MPHYVNKSGVKVNCEIVEDRGHGSIQVKWADGTTGRLKRESIIRGNANTKEGTRRETNTEDLCN